MPASGLILPEALSSQFPPTLRFLQESGLGRIGLSQRLRWCQSYVSTLKTVQKPCHNTFNFSTKLFFLFIQILPLQSLQICNLFVLMLLNRSFYVKNHFTTNTAWHPCLQTQQRCQGLWHKLHFPPFIFCWMVPLTLLVLYLYPFTGLPSWCYMRTQPCSHLHKKLASATVIKVKTQKTAAPVEIKCNEPPMKSHFNKVTCHNSMLQPPA